MKSISEPALSTFHNSSFHRRIIVWEESKKERKLLEPSKQTKPQMTQYHAHYDAICGKKKLSPGSCTSLIFLCTEKVLPCSLSTLW